MSGSRGSPLVSVLPAPRRDGEGRPTGATIIHAAARITALALAAALTLAGCGDTSDGDGAASPSPSPTSAATSGTAATAGASPSPTAESSTARVYFLVDTGARAGFRLARETRSLVGSDPAVAAVQTMIAGPEDPDYATTWNPRTKVRSVEKHGRVVSVDLSRHARRANVGSEGAAMMIQQLVYTVTDVLGEKLPVRLLVDGEPAGELWGAVVWDRPVRRAPATDVRLLVQIDSPQQGGTVASPVTVKGDGAVFEATVPWRVLDASSAVVRKGTTMTSEGMTFAPYSFRVRLAPGTYTLLVEEDDPSGGEAPGEPMQDTKAITVE